MLRVSPSGTCDVTYTPISNSHAPEAEQTISFDNCRTIYTCWFAFESESVCLYDHMTSGFPSEPNERLYLALMTVQEGNWILLPHPISVFTPGQYAGTISSSVALYEMIDDESESKAAVLLIGKGRHVHRIQMLFQPSPVERRLTEVCDRDNRVIHISVTKHDVLVVCDNKVHWMIIGKWKPVDVTPPELTGVTFTGTSVNCYISNNSTGLIAHNTAGNTEYCFVGQPSQDMLSQCGVVPNASLNHGLFINDTHFLALFDGDVGVVFMLTNDSYETIDVDFCHPQDNCLLVLTKNMVYIGNEQKTMVLDRETLEVITVRNVSVYEMLPMIERQVVPSPTSTTASTSTTANNSSTITQTTTFPINTSSTSALKSITTSTSKTDDVSSSLTRLTTTINMPTSTSAMKSTNVSITTNPATTETRLKPSKTRMAESPPPVDDTSSNNTANNPENDTKSEFGALSIIIGISIVLGLFILILLLVIVITLLVAKCRNMKLSRLVKMNHQEKIEDHRQKPLMKPHMNQGQKLSETDTARSQSDNGKPGGEVVMTPTDIEMYKLESTDTSTTVTSTVTQTTGNNMTKNKVYFNN